MTSGIEYRALQVSACVLCGHALISHHPTTLRCQHRRKPHWWSRTTLCACDMRLDRSK